MMNPTGSGTNASNTLSPEQKGRLDNVMGTPVTPSASPPKPAGADPSVHNPTPAPSIQSPFATTNSFNATTIMPPVAQTPATQTTYSAPTISPAATVTPSTVSSSSSSHTKAKSVGSGNSPMKLVLFVVVGIVLLVVYTVVWAFIFNLTLPGL